MIKTQTVSDFLNALATKSATPGGGSVAALNGATGAALLAMVCKLTIGKKAYAAVEEKMIALLAEAEDLQDRLTRLINDDTDAFNAVMAAYALPRQTEAEQQTRRQAVQAALKQATLVPLETAGACAQVIALGQAVAAHGNINSLSDAGAGVLTAHAGLKSAALNVAINLGSIDDADFIHQTRIALEEVLAGQDALVEAVYQRIKTGF